MAPSSHNASPNSGSATKRRAATDGPRAPLGVVATHGGVPTIGVLSLFLDGFFSGDLIAAIDAVARVHGARMIALETGLPWAQTWSQADLALVQFAPIAWHHIDGLIVIAAGLPEHQGQFLAASGKPVVTISVRNPLPHYPAILPDNHGGAAAAVRHLLDHGHRRIAFAGWLEQDDIRLRYAGYCAALQERGITPDPSLVFATADNNAEGGRAAAAAMLAAGLPCSAVLAGTDLCAIALMEALQAAGHRVPDDLAVIGFDDIAMARQTVPALTTVAQRFGVLGTTAAEHLLALLAHRPVRGGPVLLPTTLVCRRSCGCAVQGLAAPPHEESATLATWAETVTTRLVQQVLWPVRADATTHPELLWPGVGTIVAALDAVVQRLPKPAPASIDEAWKAACLRLSGPEALEALLVQLQQGAIERLRLLGDATSAPRRRLATFLQEARTRIDRYSVVSGLWGRRTSVAPYWTTYQLSMAMFRPESGSTAALGWARYTAMQKCCLGLWQEGAGTGERQLVVTGSYTGNHGERPGQGLRLAPEAFPPRAFLAACSDQGTPQSVLVIPLATPERAWGYLALAGPEDPSAYYSASDTLRSVPALLTVALEHEALGTELERQRHYYRALVEQSTDFVLVVERAGTIRYASPSHERLLGLPVQTLVGRSAATLLDAEDAPRLAEALAAVVRAGGTLRVGELRVRHVDGTPRTLEMFANNRLADPAVGGIILNSRDVTERKQAEALLAHQASHDALTQLPNRTLFNDRLSQLLHRAQREMTAFSLCMLDLDHFKEVNDTLGHLSGDLLLQEVASRLQQSVRAADSVARLGGDEFAVLLPDTTAPEAITVARRLLAALAAPWSLHEQRMAIAGSIGIALFPQDGMDASDLLAHADVAMYVAKAAGTGYALYDAASKGDSARTMLAHAGPPQHPSAASSPVPTSRSR